MFLLLFCGCVNAEDQSGQESQVIEKNEQQTNGLNENQNAVMKENIIDFAQKAIVVDGLQKDYEVWFFADSHIIIQDGEDLDEIQTYSAERKPIFTNEKGIDSSQILVQFVEMANEQKPDIVLFGGDILDSPSEANIAFLKSELEKLAIPYLFVMGNHDWTYPWEYMTEEGKAKYRPLLDNIMYGNDYPVQEENSEKNLIPNVKSSSYYSIAEFEDIVFLAVDDSSNQVAEEAVEGIEQAYASGKPIILIQHVPFSTEQLIAKAKENWANPVTIGMQVHGGIAPNAVSADLFSKVFDDESQIKAVLAGHVHFAYEEQISDSTVEIVTDAAFKGKAVKLILSGK